MSARPVAVSMGDPAGIGPEVTVKALSQRPDWLRQAVVVGAGSVIRQAVAAHAPHLPVVVHGAMPDQTLSPALHLWAVVPDGPVPMGQMSAAAGEQSHAAVVAAAEAVLQGRARALVTAPIHKGAWHAAGHDWPGHTERLQALAALHMGVPVSDLPVRMMLSNDALRTVLVSIHVSLRQAIERVTPANLLETLRVVQAHFLRFPVSREPLRVAVAGLNPHAGEGGAFGDEEIQIISPALAEWQAQSPAIRVSGPYPPDTVFMRAREGEFDVVIAMYHDQGLIPVKYMGLDHGVNTTLGLPFLRTSPDHGTAFDLAGRGLANPASMASALAAVLGQ